MGDLLGDAQAQAEVGAVRVGALGTVETLEDMGLVGIGDAGIVVDNADIDGKSAAGFYLAAFLSCKCREIMTGDFANQLLANKKVQGVLRLGAG